MKPVGRVLLMAEMHGRDLIRRHVALGLLVALPLSFYLASAGRDAFAPVTGGIGMAFAVSGAALFSIMSARGVDQRLVLAGYRPVELLLGRLGFLGPLALALAATFTALMERLSHPTRIWIVGLGLAAVALQAVPFGLAVGAAVPRELEGTLVVIGVIGVQLASGSDAAVSKATCASPNPPTPKPSCARVRSQRGRWSRARHLPRPAGWKSSTGFPDGSSSTICRPPGPVTMSLRNDTPPSRKRDVSASMSSTIR